MAVNPRRRRRKIDPDHAKKKAIKKAGKTALEVGSSIITPVGRSGIAEAIEKAKKKKKKQVNKLMATGLTLQLRRLKRVEKSI